MGWSKGADWLPLSNAKAHVKFWTKDLWYAEKYLTYVKSMKKYKLSGFEKIIRIARKDVQVSKKGLNKAKDKLKKTIKRVNG
jgi:hypothetical protein